MEESVLVCKLLGKKKRWGFLPCAAQSQDVQGKKKGGGGPKSTGMVKWSSINQKVKYRCQERLLLFNGWAMGGMKNRRSCKDIRRVTQTEGSKFSFGKKKEGSTHMC